MREAGWVGVEADPADLTFQDLQVFDHIHCWFVSMSIIAIIVAIKFRGFYRPYSSTRLTLFYSLVTVNVDN